MSRYVARFLPTPSARRATLAEGKIDAEGVKFLPTPSARRATAAAQEATAESAISTHALREEGDSKCAIK